MCNSVACWKGFKSSPRNLSGEEKPTVLALPFFPIELISVCDEEELMNFAGRLQECQDCLSALTRELESGVMGDTEQDINRINYAQMLQMPAGKPCHVASALSEEVSFLRVNWPKLVNVEEGLSVEESPLAYSSFLQGFCKAGAESFGAFKSTSLELIGLVTSLGVDTDDLALHLMLLEQALGLSDFLSSNDSSSFWGAFVS